jgi:hypothetical protein
MPISELPVNVFTQLLNPAVRNVFFIALAAQVMGTKSPLESTLELTNRICDRYFPA